MMTKQEVIEALKAHIALEECDAPQPDDGLYEQGYSAGLIEGFRLAIRYVEDL